MEKLNSDIETDSQVRRDRYRAPLVYDVRPRSRTCPVTLRVSRSKVVRCDLQLYEDHGLCIFHSPRSDDKKEDFENALALLLESYSKDSSKHCYEFAGFIFPYADFNSLGFLKFEKPAFFQFAQFDDYVNFYGCRFLKEVDFYNAQFLHDTSFSSASFHGSSKFEVCDFHKRVSFAGAQFKDRAIFTPSVFRGTADFKFTGFSGIAGFGGARFLGIVSFRNAVFKDLAQLSGAQFNKRVDFKGARFSNELILKGTSAAFIKDPPPTNMVLDGAILESAHLTDKRRIEKYSFRDAFILSMNFSEKVLIDCDFTGAVFKAVLTEGWQPDEKTIENTKYIYTDYKMFEIAEPNLGLRRFYERVEESRVPAEGVFGEGEHENFTIADYLNEPLKWTFALNVPLQFRTAVMNYIQFFTDFMKVTEGVSLEIRTKQEGSKLRVEFLTYSPEDKKLIQQRFEQYRINTTQEFSSLDVVFNVQTPEIEKDLFRIRYEHAINSLKTELQYTHKLLQKEEEKNALQDRYLSLVAATGSYAKEPSRLLLPVVPRTSEQSRTPIFFLTADLKDYSAATRKDETLYPAIQQFLFDQREQIQQDAVCETVKLEGDAIKVFFRDGLKLVWIAKNLINDLENLKLARPTPIRGFRVVLGYGTCYREQRGSDVDFSGEPIVLTCRVDQPMKRYIEEHQENPNQIWCTEAFRNELNNRHPNVLFEPLPQMELDKAYLTDQSIFRVSIV